MVQQTPWRTTATIIAKVVAKPRSLEVSYRIHEAHIVHLTRISMWTGSETRTKTTKIESESRSQFSKDQQITVLRDTVISCRGKFIAEFSHVDEHYISLMTIESCLDYIERQRLTHMPHRGSRWDKVLKWAEYFALQVSGFAKAVGSFVPDSKIAANLILTASRVLLEVNLAIPT